MTKVLVTFASSHGATAEIAQTIGTVLRKNQLLVDVTRIEGVKDVNQYDAIVLGSAIYTGEWMELAKAFLHEHAEILKKQYVWIFSSGPTGEGNPIELLDGVLFSLSVEEIIKQIQPRDVAVFGGKIDLRRLRKDERLIVKAANVPKGDFRNWHAIKFWAQQIADALKIVAIDTPCDKALLPVAK
ncbi:MAG: flavodoxin domain-containing protein [Anaerolineae bacterium]|nr:flavodoxin domain-containing protein [Anaerolineae bacterium]MDQ7035666.1 flavodoxin domain-containing protein [Anaerolineae bacterium]